MFRVLLTFESLLSPTDAVSAAQRTHAQYINFSTNIVTTLFLARTYRRENIVDETNQSPWEELLVQ